MVQRELPFVTLYFCSCVSAQGQILMCFLMSYDQTFVTLAAYFRVSPWVEFISETHNFTEFSICGVFFFCWKSNNCPPVQTHGTVETSRARLGQRTTERSCSVTPCWLQDLQGWARPPPCMHALRSLASRLESNLTNIFESKDKDLTISSPVRNVITKTWAHVKSPTYNQFITDCTNHQFSGVKHLIWP